MPEDGPSTMRRMLPTGSTAGSAATMPVRVLVPDFVSPDWQYAVAFTLIVAGVAATDAMASTAAHRRLMIRADINPRAGSYDPVRLGLLSHLKKRITTI